MLIDNSCLLLMENRYLRLKATINMLTFQNNFKNISSGFSATEFREISLNGNVYDISVNYNSIDKSDISNIYKYYMTKNDIKLCLAFINKCLLYY